MIALNENSRLAPEDYLRLEEKSLLKHEYIDGEIYAMAGTTDSHNTIALNLAVLIRNHLRGTNCRVYFADIKARLEERNRFYYPDLLVTCDPKDAETPTYKRFPKLVIEVLSDSTESFDRGAKFSDYQTLASLEEYVLVNSRRWQVEIYRRAEAPGWQWQYFNHTPAHPALTLASVGLDLTLAEVYEDVSLETEGELSFPESAR
ncbi:MAG: Uma2 family endonuclease [Cyanobacteria bacterium RI_101]|nr:Uma2 family endonuclease [Cyanobacteria bacterium RI_101]